jgi:hypothetical protein
MNKGENNYDEMEGKITNYLIHHGGKMQSRIVFPIIYKVKRAQSNLKRLSQNSNGRLDT